MRGLNPDGVAQFVRVDADGKLMVSGAAGGGAGGTSDTLESTQVLVKAAVQSIDAKTPALVGGALPVADAQVLARIPALVNARTPVDTDRVTKQLIDSASATVTYVCEAAEVNTATSAAGWRIKRITVAGSVTTIQWGGTGAFDQIADNRATTVVYA